jgi:hypothetical protein
MRPHGFPWTCCVERGRDVRCEHRCSVELRCINPGVGPRDAHQRSDLLGIRPQREPDDGVIRTTVLVDELADDRRIDDCAKLL